MNVYIPSTREAMVNDLQNVAQFIAGQLERMILDGTLAPGTRLIQTEIAEQYKVSRLPVRDAFRILEKKELVVALPRKGMEVRRVSAKEALELFELRWLLERYAAEQSLYKFQSEDVEEAAK